MGLTAADFEGRHLGADIYVLGSGPALNHVDPSFWQGRIIVAANHGCTFAGITPTYLVTKYHAHALEYLDRYPGIPVITPRHNCGQWAQEQAQDDRMVIVDTNDNTCARWEPTQWPERGGMVATWSTITTAMHWAAHLGARTILMCGADSGWIAGRGRVAGYGESMGDSTDDHDRAMWEAFDFQTRLVKAELQARYGCSVMSVSGFINGNCEGNELRSFAGTLNMEAP